MDNKTANLRDLFIETTGSKKTTESQAVDRGTLLKRAAADDVDAALSDIVDEMESTFTFRSSLSQERYVELIKTFYSVGGRSAWSISEDAQFRPSVAEDAIVIRTARIDLHLIADVDRIGPLSPNEAYQRSTDHSLSAIANTVGCDLDTIERLVRVGKAESESRRVNHQYRNTFRQLLTDAELSEQLTADAREDGLREATEDIETNVSL
ncbi:MAG: hypothetical protein J07HQX50_02785 [Haloquadratum sp. J07HQX50]|jgi:hypothetical protein|nr:MAG: hypothetical protein J07HQX50_02785 [Haloquadratum sp. J07HQX50]